MQSCTFIILAAVVALALAEGQFYVPRAYYIIDAEGHESPPVPLRRLRRSTGSVAAYPNYPGSGASANAHADAWGDNANAHANAKAVSGGEPSRPKELSAWNLPGWNMNHGGGYNPAYKN